MGQAFQRLASLQRFGRLGLPGYIYIHTVYIYTYNIYVYILYVCLYCINIYIYQYYIYTLYIYIRSIHIFWGYKVVSGIVTLP